MDALDQAGTRIAGGRGPQRHIPCVSWGGALRVRSGRRGGWLGPLLGDRYLAPTRVLREFGLWLELRAAGVDLPQPAFAASRRHGLFWRSKFASVDLPEAIDGRALLESEGSGRELHAAAAAAGKALRSLHDAGVLHGDLHLRNLLFERTDNPHPGWRCRLIDLDSASRRRSPSPRERLRDGLRLARSLEKTGFGDAWTPRVQAAGLAAYCRRDRDLRRDLLGATRRERARLRRHRLGWRLRRLLAGGLSAVALFSAGCSPQAGDNALIEPVKGARHSMLAVGDTGRTRPFAGLFEGQLSVSAGMTEEARRGPVDALVLLGDNFYWDGLGPANLVPRIRTNLVRPYCHFLRLDGPRSPEVADACPLPIEERAPVPIYAVLGNHDIERAESPRLQREVVPEFLPDWTMGRGLAKAFELGEGLSLILLESEPRIDYREEVVEALRAAIRSAQGPWRIIAVHRPIATDDNGTPWLGGYPSFVRDAIEAEGLPVQLVLAAHHHNLQAFELGEPTPLLQLGLGSGARAEPPLASADHPDVRFSRLALGFARIDLVGRGEDERLIATLIEAPPWPLLSPFVGARAVARFEVDRGGRVRASRTP